MNNEKLYADFSEDETIILEQVPDNEHNKLIESKIPFFSIVMPGYYTIERQRTVKPNLDELKKVWARLTKEEREGFITGLEVANIPAAKPEEFPF
jgi:hypothetical protein